MTGVWHYITLNRHNFCRDLCILFVILYIMSSRVGNLLAKDKEWYHTNRYDDFMHCTIEAGNAS